MNFERFGWTKGLESIEPEVVVKVENWKSEVKHTINLANSGRVEVGEKFRRVRTSLA